MADPGYQILLEQHDFARLIKKKGPANSLKGRQTENKNKQSTGCQDPFVYISWFEGGRRNRTGNHAEVKGRPRPGPPQGTAHLRHRSIPGRESQGANPQGRGKTRRSGSY